MRFRAFSTVYEFSAGSASGAVSAATNEVVDEPDFDSDEDWRMELAFARLGPSIYD